MVNVELNIFGFRISREIPDRRRKSVRSREFGPRPVYWRLPRPRQSHAA